ncbi:ABC transporter ATP-binding protein [Bacillus marinisedimentorum]|uniref:ABC transporter ATP-binding protein n=1 Tax=Bacillus marinisedimentorum TaxID=1821260 RepID=UPI0007DED0AF|nr:ABC transporter ATP-binding protein [Bacillus marinisedimentorum]
MEESVVTIKNLTKKIGNKTIIDDISFDIYPGEVFGFLGPNGAGKTTTIRMMVGLMSITKGQVLIKGKSIRENFEEAIRHVGGIVENPEMYKFLTGYQNLVHYSRMVNGVGRQRIDEVVSLVGLENRINDKVKTYSLGMRQRLGLAQALLHKPDILILDEPTNGLDPAGIREIRTYLRKLAAEENLAVLVSSHLLSEMQLMCDRIGIIQNGKLVDVKRVDEFIVDGTNMSVQFTAAPADEAFTLFRAHYPETEASVTEGGFEAVVAKEEIPKITALLVKGDIEIYGINTAVKTLEEKFLEVTGGNQIV